METINQFKEKYLFLSNFSKLPNGITYENMLYPTAEHAIQAAKTNSKELRRKIAMCASPLQAKKLGETIEERPEWKDEMFRCLQMFLILKDKFTQPDLKKRLLETKNAKLTNENFYFDDFWGVDMRKKAGKNHLGKLLMKVRKELQGTQKVPKYDVSAFGPKQLELRLEG